MLTSKQQLLLSLQHTLHISELAETKIENGATTNERIRKNLLSENQAEFDQACQEMAAVLQEYREPGIKDVDITLLRGIYTTNHSTFEW